ncbi:MAG: hypothetical protein K6G44_01845 [Lentisphaeria bacterium]|nr:hypothetical protein [Lentisphaeria bacterium]
MENGQYNADWDQIHTLPSELPQFCRDLGAKEVVTVHHSQYTLSKHPWDKLRRNEDTLEKKDSTGSVALSWESRKSSCYFKN